MVARSSHLPPDHEEPRHERLPLFMGQEADAWIERALDFLVQHARAHGAVSANDLWDWIQSDTDNAPIHEKHVGQAFATAVNRKQLRNTDRRVVSTRSSRNAGKVFVYEVGS